MYKQFNNQHTQTQNTLSTAVCDYYNDKREDRNLSQSVFDGYVHHHFGLGPTSINAAIANHDQITQEIQRQETSLTDHLIDLLNINSSDDHRVLDAGCGRGGSMLRIAHRYPLSCVDGVTISRYQAEFCNTEFIKQRLTDRLEVRHANFLSLPYRDEYFTRAYCCETTQYALDLEPLFREIYRTLQLAGLFVIATWCFNDDDPTTDVEKFVEPINDHYASTMHGINEYTETLKRAGFTVIGRENRTRDLIPYWELRNAWKMRSGIEQCFIDHHRTNELQYHFIVAKK